MHLVHPLIRNCILSLRIREVTVCYFPVNYPQRSAAMTASTLKM